MGKYRKRPIVIEAILASDVLRLAREGFDSLPAWLIAAYTHATSDIGIVFAGDHVIIKTLEGIMRAESTDWIICGVKGELYPCKPEIFEATYEPVED